MTQGGVAVFYVPLVNSVKLCDFAYLKPLVGVIK